MLIQDLIIEKEERGSFLAVPFLFELTIVLFCIIHTVRSLDLGLLFYGIFLLASQAVFLYNNHRAMPVCSHGKDGGGVDLWQNALLSR